MDFEFVQKWQSQVKKRTLALILLLFPGLGFAQSVMIKGKVKNMQDLPIEGATIVLYDSSSALAKPLAAFYFA